jgi:DNA-binding transcriptional LysR family regulator
MALEIHAWSGAVKHLLRKTHHFDAMASDGLLRVLPDWHGAPVPVCALTETRLLPAKTQRFIEFLRERLLSAGEENKVSLHSINTCIMP